MPTKRLKYLQKKEGLGKCKSSAMSAMDFSVCINSIFIRVISARSIHSFAVTPLVLRMVVLR